MILLIDLRIIMECFLLGLLYPTIIDYLKLMQFNHKSKIYSLLYWIFNLVFGYISYHYIFYGKGKPNIYLLVIFIVAMVVYYTVFKRLVLMFLSKAVIPINFVFKYFTVIKLDFKKLLGIIKIQLEKKTRSKNNEKEESVQVSKNT